MEATKANPQLTDGVWRAPYTVDGHSVLVAVVGGDRVAEMVLRPGIDVEDARLMLWQTVKGPEGGDHE